MRPPSIILFERLFLSSLLLAFIQAAIGWHELMSRGSAEEIGAVLALSVLTLAGLVLLVSRGRSASAKWVLTFLLFAGLPLLLMSLVRGSVVGWAPLAVVQAALQAGSIALLFTPSAREWLGQR